MDHRGSPSWNDMTDSRAVADYRREIIREIERRIADLATRLISGPVALQRFRLWLLARAEEKKEGAE